MSGRTITALVSDAVVRRRGRDDRDPQPRDAPFLALKTTLRGDKLRRDGAEVGQAELRHPRLGDRQGRQRDVRARDLDEPEHPHRRRALAQGPGCPRHRSLRPRGHRPRPADVRPTARRSPGQPIALNGKLHRTGATPVALGRPPPPTATAASRSLVPAGPSQALTVVYPGAAGILTRTRVSRAARPGQRDDPRVEGPALRRRVGPLLRSPADARHLAAAGRQDRRPPSLPARPLDDRRHRPRHRARPAAGTPSPASAATRAASRSACASAAKRCSRTSSGTPPPSSSPSAEPPAKRVVRSHVRTLTLTLAVVALLALAPAWAAAGTYDVVDMRDHRSRTGSTTHGSRTWHLGRSTSSLRCRRS